MSLSPAQQAIAALRDAGVIPAQAANALLPAKRRKVALCMNRGGSARRPEGACTKPIARLYEALGDGEWRHAGTLCEKCLAAWGHLYTNPAHYRIQMLEE